MADFAHLRDVLGQVEFVKIYTHMLLGFRLSPDIPQQTVIDDVQRAAAQLVEHIPWLAGHVIFEGRDATKKDSGLSRVILYEPGVRDSVVVTKDCTSLCPSLDEITAAGGPMSMLDTDILAMTKGIPSTYDELKERAPVMVIQVNFIKSGILLVFQGNHSIMDMNGMGGVIQLFAKIMRGEMLTDQEVAEANEDRRESIKLLKSGEQRAEITHRFIPPPLPAGQDPPPKPEDHSQWVYWHFKASKMAELKALALKPSPQADSSRATQWISTDDAISAFFVQSITRARLRRLGSSTDNLTLNRAINARSRLSPPLPAGYTGMMVFTTDTSISLTSALATTDLAGLAQLLRRELLAVTPLEIRTLATMVNEHNDKSAVRYGASLNLQEWDMIISSWSHLPMYSTSFGNILGKPLIAKRPPSGPVEGLMYCMPKTMDGDVDVAACLRKEDIDALRQDDVFIKYAKYVG